MISSLASAQGSSLYAAPTFICMDASYSLDVRITDSVLRGAFFFAKLIKLGPDFRHTEALVAVLWQEFFVSFRAH